jgi:hypothetical protein
MPPRPRKSAGKPKPRTPPRRAAKKAAAPAARPAAEEALDTLAQLQRVKADLEAISVKLNGIDPDRLDSAAREQWSKEMDRVDLAIARARNAILNRLVEAFEAEVTVIRNATGNLAATLEHLNQSAEVIDAVANVLGVIERVITLGR